jgi:prolipoprotein diacylglyceryl transferase
MVGYFFWNPESVAFIVPYLHFPVYWYSIFFALGVYGAVLIIRSMIISRAIEIEGHKSETWAVTDKFVERLTVYAFIGMIIGARVGHVLFYDAQFFFDHPAEIVKVWHGGLSSHGAVVGLLLGLWLFSRKKWSEVYLPQGMDLLDVVSIGSAFTAGCIRIGNFFNQEIIGIQTSVPWAVVFGNPQDSLGAIPRHPTQVYEALVSFSLLGALVFYGRKGRFATNGLITGIYLVITFTSRILLETLKTPQCEFDTGHIHMGQLLSLPFVLLGLFLIVRIYAGKSKGQT